MSVVKGSKPTRLMVVPYRPYQRAVMITGLGLMLLAVGAGAFFLGAHLSVGQQGDAVVERDQLRLELQAKTLESEALSQQVANLRLASEVDKASSEDVRNQVIQLKEQIASLEQDITFYRGLMAPTENERGLSIGSLDVISTGKPRQYAFKVVMQQLETNHQVLNGSLQVNVVGYQGEELRSIPLSELSPQIEASEIKLRFKYFQNIEGEIHLPEGFEPERIELLARSTGRNATTVEKKFGWLIRES